jgi:hypothetical protein
MSAAVSSSDGAASESSLSGEPWTRAISLLEQRQYASAIAKLEEVVRSDSPPDLQALLGTAYFLAARYEDAKRCFELAVRACPHNADWQNKLMLAMANAVSKAEDPFPPVDAFDRESLLAPPSLKPGAIPATASAPNTPRRLAQVVTPVEKVFGAIVTSIMNAASFLAGKLGTSDEVWSNWYRKPLLLGLVTLQAMRDRLDARNLVNPYPEGALTAFQSRGLVPPDGVQFFRTADGTWNNLSEPKEGAANVRFPRNVSRLASWPENGTRLMTPNPAEVSHLLLSRGPNGMKEVPFLNMLAASWIQFMVHDWVSHHTAPTGDVYEVVLPPDHPARKLFYQTTLYVPKTEADPTRSPQDAGLPPTTINEVTSWWDGSQIYGSDQKTLDDLRAFRDGKLTIDERGHLPIGTRGIEQTGYNRDWWVGLSMMHTMFVREHNAICEMLKRHYPEWDDARLFNVARLINAAVMAKIHTIEWTPAILPNRGLYLAMHANWYGLAETTLHSDPKSRRIRRAFKIPNAEIGGIVGNATDKHGKPYGLSEEFTEIYRMHELLPDAVVLRSMRDGRSLGVVPLAQTRQRGAHALSERFGFVDLFYSFGNQHPGQLVLNNYPRTLQQLTIPGNPVFDLGAVDILRARERGVPRYNEYRRQVGLMPIRVFEDLTSDPKELATLKRVYNHDVELIDMQIGSRAESQRPTGFGFGETLFQIFILNASRRLEADRFFTESYTEEVYTKEGLAWVDDATLKAVLLRHYPELAASGLSNVANAFEPWDTGELLLSRHPLRGFSVKG